MLKFFRAVADVFTDAFAVVGSRKNAVLCSTAHSTAGDTVPLIIPPITPPITRDLSSAIASTIASSLMITMWVDFPKPFPARETRPGGSFQVWSLDSMPVKHPTAEQLAGKLYVALQRHCAGEWLLAQCIEQEIFPAVCEQLGWPPRSWKGKDGVAAHLARLLPPPRYMRAEIEGGEVSKRLHYFIPQPAADTIVPLRRA